MHHYEGGVLTGRTYGLELTNHTNDEVVYIPIDPNGTLVTWWFNGTPFYLPLDLNNIPAAYDFFNEDAGEDGEYIGGSGCWVECPFEH